MGIRDWAGDWIQNGNVLQWAIGWLIKLGIESGLAVVFGRLAVLVGDYLFGLEAIFQVGQVSTIPALWLATSIGVFYLLFCDGVPLNSSPGGYQSRLES